jgi:hypothetical protein
MEMWRWRYRWRTVMITRSISMAHPQKVTSISDHSVAAFVDADVGMKDVVAGEVAKGGMLKAHELMCQHHLYLHHLWALVYRMRRAVPRQCEKAHLEEEEACMGAYIPSLSLRLGKKSSHYPIHQQTTRQLMTATA